MVALDVDDRMAAKWASYPEAVLPKLQRLRTLILETATSLALPQLTETLKWGEPSYLVKGGSTIRVDWKAKKPTQYALYLKCTSQLVPTVKAKYGTLFCYEGNRALVFDLEAALPDAALREVIQWALRYHHLKHLPALGTTIKNASGPEGPKAS